MGYSIAMLVYQRLTKNCWFAGKNPCAVYIYVLICWKLDVEICLVSYCFGKVCAVAYQEDTHIHCSLGLLGMIVLNWQAAFIFPENSTKGGTTSIDWWCGASAALVQHESFVTYFFYTVFPCSLQNSVAACAVFVRFYQFRLMTASIFYN